MEITLSKEQENIMTWLCVRHAIKGIRISIILDRKYLQKNVMGFSGISTVLALFAVTEGVPRNGGLLLGYTRNNTKLLEKMKELAPKTYTSEHPTREEFILKKNEERHVWKMVNVTDNDHLRGGTSVDMIIADQVRSDDFQRVCTWLISHPELYCMDADFHMILTFQSWDKEQDNVMDEEQRTLLHQLFDIDVFTVSKPQVYPYPARQERTERIRYLIVDPDPDLDARDNDNHK